MPSWNPRMASESRCPPGRRWQFSIRITLLAVTMCALAVAGWKAFLWQPPTHGIAIYEQAPAFYGRTAKIGPNQIRIESVARNDRDGGISVETGRGQPLDVPVVGDRRLVNCASWLDVAQIELQPGGDLLDIIEVRIFDHAQRALLSRLDPAYGWNVVAPNLLQVYGLNQSLPETLDIWLRVNSYSADDDVYQLAPTAGATVPELLPLDVRVRLVDGDFGSGSTTGGTSMSLIPRPDGPTERGKAFSLIIDERGIGEIPFHFRFRQQGSWTAGTNYSGSARSTGSSRTLIERDYRVPIGSIDEVEISVTAAP